MKKKYYRNTPANIKKIVAALKESAERGEEFLTLSELARRSKIHKWSVSRVLDIYMSPFVETIQPPELESIGIQVKIVKLKDANISPDRIIKYCEIKKKVGC